MKVAWGWLWVPNRLPTACLPNGFGVVLGWLGVALPDLWPSVMDYQELDNFRRDGVDARRNPAGGESFHPLSPSRRRRVNPYRPKYIARPPSAETAPAAR